jgi:beta-fructofuranosidase
MKTDQRSRSRLKRIPAIFAALLLIPAAGLRGGEIADKTHVSFIHYRPAKGKVGDTIPFFWQGRHHVFYLNESRWDHIVSTDLVHWQELPPALSRGRNPLGPDGEACWTGSIVEHGGTFHLFYTGKNMRDPAGDQKVMAATSTNLIQWQKLPARTFYADGKHYWSKPVNGSAEPLGYHHQAFRDPDVFYHEGRREWWLLLHALRADTRQPCIGLYTSPDLIAWKPQPPLATYDPSLSLDCPHAAPVGGRWFIIAADTSYTTAPTPDGPYPAGMMPYDSGNLFVPKSLFDGKRRIIWGWVCDLEAGRDAGKSQWGGTMSMAHEIYPDAQGRLCSRPPTEVIAAFAKSALDLADRPAPAANPGGWHYEGGILTSGSTNSACAYAAPGNYMLKCDVRLAPGTELTVTMREQEDGSGYRLSLRPDRGQVELQRGAARFSRQVELDASRPISLQAFVLGSILECFVNGHALTCRAYDHQEGRLGLAAAGGKAEVMDLKIRTPGKDK